MQFVLEFDLIFKDPNTATFPTSITTCLVPGKNEIVRMKGCVFRVSEVVHVFEGNSHHVSVTLVEQ